MKSFIYILLTSLTFLVVGCQNESEEIRLINQAERLFDAYPDSVITTLDSIPLPEEMSPRLIARWCMLYARAADKIEDEMPYTNQLEIALKYYQKKKMREEEAEIGLYLGRSYVEDKEYEKAMRAYSDALEVALAIKNYNRAGYICSYMGDLYELDDRYVLAAKKYKESGRYFRLAGNMKSYVRSFVNEGRSYMDVDSNYLALTILKRAEVIIDSLRVDEVRNYVYNGLGNIFNVLEKYDLAEKYLLKSIKEDSIKNYQNKNGVTILLHTDVYNKLLAKDQGGMLGHVGENPRNSVTIVTPPRFEFSGRMEIWSDEMPESNKGTAKISLKEDW